MAKKSLSNFALKVKFEYNAAFFPGTEVSDNIKH